MSLIFNSRPNTYQASAMPIVYKMTRKDVITDSVIAAASSRFKVVLAGVNQAAAYTARIGQTLWLKTDDGIYNQMVTIRSAAYTGSDTEITMEEQEYTADAGAGYFNLLTARAQYEVEVQVYNGIDDTKIGVSISTSPDQEGNIVIDVSNPIHRKLKAQLPDAYVAPLDIDQNAFVNYYIEYEEQYVGSIGNVVSDSANKRNAIYAVLQIGDDVALTDYSTSPVKFLNKFTGIKWPREVPFFLSFIALVTDARVVLKKYRNGVLDTTTNYDIADGLGLYHFKLPVEAQVLVTSVEINVIDISTTNPISETITITYTEKCDNSLYALWRNELGGLSQFEFAHNFMYKYELFQGGKHKRITAVAVDLTQAQFEALQSMSSYNDIYRVNIREFTSALKATLRQEGSQVYHTQPDGSLIGVVVVPQKDTVEAKWSKAEFSIDFIMPQTFER